MNTVIKIILADPRHRHLYETNAHFKQGVDTMLSMVPIYLTGLAAFSENRRAEMLEMQEAIMRKPFFRSEFEGRWLTDE